MTEQSRTVASPISKVDLLTAGISREFRQNRPEDEQSFGVRRRDPFGPALRERFRDSPGRPHAACAQVWVSRRFRASSCVPTWSRPDCSRLSSLGNGAGLCWRLIIAVTANPNTTGTRTTTRFLSHSPTLGRPDRRAVVSF